MDPKTSKLYCSWAAQGLALHNSGGALLCCQSRTYLRDPQGQQIFWHTHSLEDAWRSPTRQEIINALDQGIQHPNCEACWVEENSGGKSRRQWHIDIIDHSRNTQDLPVLLDLKLGNICNLACRTCNPSVSSRWYRDWWEVIDRHNSRHTSYNEYLDSVYLTSKLSYSNDNTQLWQTLDQWFEHAQYVDIYGAEPMMIDRLFEILDRSIRNGRAAKQTLHFNTNATIWDDQKIDILSKFQKTCIDLSIDGISQHYDYIRYGKTWDEVEPNIRLYDQFRQKNTRHIVNICITVSILNIFYLNEIWDYFASRNWNLDIHFNLAHFPKHVNLKVIPAEIKPLVKEKLLSFPNKEFQKAVEPVISYMMHEQYPDDTWKEFIRVTKELDVRRDQSFPEVFPEWYNLIKSYF